MQSYGVKIDDLFTGYSKVFKIPIYQRRYVWAEDNWLVLWRDVATQVDLLAKGQADDTAPHFTGTLVLQIGKRETEPAIIIDGQQRLTSFQIIFCALRDVAKEYKDDGLAEKSADCIIRKDADPDLTEPRDLWRLVPLKESHDYRAFDSMVSEKEASDENHGITRAHRFFKKQIKAKCRLGQEKTLSVIFRVLLTRFCFIKIEIDATTRDAERIFESLNGRGRLLSSFDHLRNNLFLRAEDDHKRTEYYRTYWSEFDESWDEASRNSFLITFLGAQLLGETTSTKIDPFELYQSKYRNHKKSVEEEFRILKKYSEPYKAITQKVEDYQRSDEEGDERSFLSLIEVLRAFDWTSWYPFVLFVRSEISQNVRDFYQILESYLLRLATYYGERHVVELGPVLGYSRSIAAISEIARQVKSGEKPTWRDFLRELSMDTGGTSTFPNDGMIGAAFEGRRPISSKVKKYLLHRIEGKMREQKGDEADEISWARPKYSLEHVMPQRWEATWKLNSKGNPLFCGDIFKDESRSLSPRQLSKEDLRDPEDPNLQAYLQKVKDRYDCIQSMGNLTVLPFGQNHNLKNKSFEEKRSVFRRSPLLLNQAIADRKVWDVEAIRDRTGQLLHVYQQIWPSRDGFWKRYTGRRDELAEVMDGKKCVMATSTKYVTMNEVTCQQYEIVGNDSSSEPIKKEHIFFLYEEKGNDTRNSSTRRPVFQKGSLLPESVEKILELARKGKAAGLHERRSGTRDGLTQRVKVGQRYYIISKIGDLFRGMLIKETNHELFLEIAPGRVVIFFRRALHCAPVLMEG